MFMKRFFAAAAALMLFAAAIVFHAEISTEILVSGRRCVTVLVPSLYLCSVLAAFLVRSGLLGILAQPVHRLSRALFHMDGDLFVILLFSQIAGYPVGAQLLQQLDGISGRKQQALLTVCFGCGPAFLTGTLCAASRIPPELLAVLFLSIILPNLLIALVIARRLDLRRNAPMRPVLSVNARTFTESAASGASAMLNICGMVLAFSAFMGMAKGLLAQLCGAAEMPVGAAVLLEISNLPDFLQNGGSLPAAAAFLSFGGICVHLQNAAVCGGKFPWKLFWSIRITAAGCTYVLCRFGLELLGRGTAQAAFLPESVCQPAFLRENYLPSLCLLVMSLLLLRKQDECGV